MNSQAFWQWSPEKSRLRQTTIIQTTKTLSFDLGNIHRKRTPAVTWKRVSRKNKLTSSDVGSRQETKLLTFCTILSDACIEILKNGWPEICCFRVSKQDMMEQILNSKHLQTESHTRVYKSQIHPQKGGRSEATAHSVSDPHLIYAGVWVILCVGV